MSVLFWNVRLEFGKLDSNHHDWEKTGKGLTILGPKLSIVKLERLTQQGVKQLLGRRLWFYFPSGACWNADLYLVEPRIKS